MRKVDLWPFFYECWNEWRKKINFSIQDFSTYSILKSWLENIFNIRWQDQACKFFPLRNYYLLVGFWKKPSSKKICIRLNQQFFKSYLCQDDLGFWHQNPCPKQNTDEVLHFYSVFDSIILTRSPKVIPLNCSKEDLIFQTIEGKWTN